MAQHTHTVTTGPGRVTLTDSLPCASQCAEIMRGVVGGPPDEEANWWVDIDSDLGPGRGTHWQKWRRRA